MSTTSTSGTSAEIDLTRYAEVMGHLRYFPADKHAEVIARLGIRRRDWDAAASKWQRVRDAERLSGKLEVTVRFGRRMAETRAKLEARQPTLESLGPFPGPDRAPDEAAAPPASKAAPAAKSEDVQAALTPVAQVPSAMLGATGLSSSHAQQESAEPRWARWAGVQEIGATAELDISMFRQVALPFAKGQPSPEFFAAADAARAGRRASARRSRARDYAAPHAADGRRRFRTRHHGAIRVVRRCRIAAAAHSRTVRRLLRGTRRLSGPRRDHSPTIRHRRRRCASSIGRGVRVPLPRGSESTTALASAGGPLRRLVSPRAPEVSKMSRLVVHGAKLSCSEGMAPSALTILPVGPASADDKPAATIADMAPMLNIAPFGMCKAQTNPQVAAATAAAMGVLTPMPCIPVIAGPWSPGATRATINDVKALTNDSKCSCAWAGSIEITDPGSDIDVE